jgi:collagen type III alpha
MLDTKALAAALLKTVREWVEPAVKGLSARIDALEERLKEVPSGPRGERGEKGDPGADGKDGAPGRDGKDGAQGEKGLAGERGEKGEPGDRGEKGEPGEPGKDGQAGERGEKGDPGKDGQDGRDGAPGDRGEKGEPGERGEKGETGLRGEKGEPGEAGERGEKGMDGRDGRDGKDGRDGAAGRDGAEIQPLTAIDAAKSYPQGTWAKHAGGLWLARAATDGMTGWDCIVSGIDSIELELGEDLRTLSLQVRCSNGTAVTKSVEMPVVIDRGIYRQDDTYAKGDGVTWAGSYWIAQKGGALGKPGEGETGWRLAVKKGRDGRDGAKGEKGDRGPEGRAGKDLTQLGFDGKKH